jgi:hypothetical protein
VRKAPGDGLSDKHVERVAVMQNEVQWYGTFYFNSDQMALSDIDEALKGSPLFRAAGEAAIV